MSHFIIIFQQPRPLAVIIAIQFCISQGPFMEWIISIKEINSALKYHHGDKIDGANN
jgi:hypothetical protein